MAKLTTLNGNPAGFDLTVTTQNLQGADVEITFKCKGRTLRDWHPVYAKRIADDTNRVIANQAEREEKSTARKKESKVDKVEFNEGEIKAGIEDSLKQAASVVLEVADGWDIADEFNEASIMNMIDKFPGTHQKLHAEYDARIRGNRAKN